MKISGFSMVKNATKLHYPIKQAIGSILPLVDEFVVAVGDNDPGDHTVEEIESLRSEKIRIIHTVWDLERYPRGMEHAHQTDIAKEACTGDWLFYVQSDEVVHEKYLPVIKKRCEELLDDEEVEGLLFNYIHFWGDYDHYVDSHVFYKNEIRIIRNQKDIHSWESAQSFRRIPDFDYLNYRRDKKGTFKLNVAKVDASIYHYGWGRPPHLMQRKRKAFDVNHFGVEKAENIHKDDTPDFDYGDLDKLPVFKDTHPAVMKEMIEKFDWSDQLKNFNKTETRFRHKHDKLKYRLLSYFENNFLNGKQIFNFKNYRLLNK